MDAVVRRLVHGGRGAAELRAQLAHGIECVSRSRRDVLARAPAGSELGRIEAIEAPMSWFAAGQLVSLVALAWLGHVSFGMPVWQSIIAVGVVVPAGAGGVPGDGRDRHHAGRRHGQGHAAHLRRAEPRQRQRQPDERQHHGRCRHVGRRSARRPEERLPAGRQPAPAVPGPVRRHLRRHVWSPCSPSPPWCPTPRCSAPTSSRRRPRRPGRPSPSRSAKGLSALEPVKLWLIWPAAWSACCSRSRRCCCRKYREYLPSAAAFGLAWVFHWYYGLLFFLGALIALLLERQKTANRRGVHLSRRLGRGGWRLADGRAPGALGEWRQHSRKSPAPLMRSAL